MNRRFVSRREKRAMRRGTPKQWDNILSAPKAQAFLRQIVPWTREERLAVKREKHRLRRRYPDSPTFRGYPVLYVEHLDTATARHTVDP